MKIVEHPLFSAKCGQTTLSAAATVVVPPLQDDQMDRCYNKFTPTLGIPSLGVYTPKEELGVGNHLSLLSLDS